MCHDMGDDHDTDAGVAHPFDHGEAAPRLLDAERGEGLVEEDELAAPVDETVELDGGLIKFFCIPHESAQMKGHVVLASATTSTETPQMGVFLRAYWIGLLGIAGTMLLVAISYFVIKGSSRHYRDHREHIRRGLT